MHDRRTALGRDIRAQIHRVFGQKVFSTVITKSVRLEESPAYKESIFTFAPESSGAAEYYRLCRRSSTCLSVDFQTASGCVTTSTTSRPSLRRR